MDEMESSALSWGEVAGGEVEEGRPVGGRGDVSAGVVVEAEGAVDKRGVEGRRRRGAEVLPAEEAVDRARGDLGEELPLGVGPLVRRSARDEDGSWGDEG